MTFVPNARSVKTETPLAIAWDLDLKQFIAIPVDVLPSGNAIGATGIGQPFAGLVTLVVFVVVEWRQYVGNVQVGGVEIENMTGKRPL
jgi:hypothetical protein